MMYLGDYTEDATVHFAWSTSDVSGGAITRATDGTIQVYKDDGTTEETANITDTEDFDSLTGVHMCKIDASVSAFFAAGHDYSVVLSAATIDGQTVNTVLVMFSIENRFAEVDVTKIGGDAQSATDLKDFADAGYDPATNKVQGVVLTDTTTTNTDMRGTDSAATATNLATVDTVVDGIQTDLSNGTDGLGALKALIDTANTALAHGTYGLSALQVLIAALQTDLDNGTDGLGALKALIDTATTNIGTVDTVVDGIQTDLSNETDGLGALKTLVDAVNTDLGNGTDGLGALKALIDTLTTNVGTVDTVVDGIQTDLSNETDGLGAIKALIDALENISTANVTAACTSSLNTYDPPTKAELDTAQAAVTLADGAHGGSSTVITAQKVVVASSGNDDAVSITGSGTGDGMAVTGGASAGTGLQVTGGAGAGHGIGAQGAGGGSGIITAGGSTGRGLEVMSGNTSGSAVHIFNDNAGSPAVYVAGGSALASTGIATDVTLADDAITASKYDEATAHPVKSADTGATQIARTGADGDTLETLSDEIAVVDGNVDSVLTDTGTTLDAAIAVVDANVDAILTDTGTTLPASIATVDSNVDAVLVDTGTTLPATLTTIEGKIDTADAVCDAIQTDTEDIQSRLPAALVSGRMSSDAEAISGDTTAADNLEASTETIVTGTATAGTLSTTQMSTNLTEATDDHYNGRTILWRTGVLAGQGTDITDYNGTTKVLTYTTVTEAPSADDTFVIV